MMPIFLCFISSPVLIRMISFSTVMTSISPGGFESLDTKFCFSRLIIFHDKRLDSLHLWRPLQRQKGAPLPRQTLLLA